VGRPGPVPMFPAYPTSLPTLVAAISVTGMTLKPNTDRPDIHLKPGCYCTEDCTQDSDAAGHRACNIDRLRDRLLLSESTRDVARDREDGPGANHGIRLLSRHRRLRRSGGQYRDRPAFGASCLARPTGRRSVPATTRHCEGPDLPGVARGAPIGRVRRASSCASRESTCR